MSGRPALPIGLYLTGRRVVLVGAEPALSDRRRRLEGAGAEVTEVSPEAFTEEQAQKAFAVFIAHEDTAVVRGLAERARPACRLVYAQDVPELSDFAMPALASRGYLRLAISTDGQAPALARRLREEFERLLATGGQALDALLDALASARGSTAPSERGRVLGALANALEIRGQISISSPSEATHSGSGGSTEPTE